MSDEAIPLDLFQAISYLEVEIASPPCGRRSNDKLGEDLRPRVLANRSLANSVRRWLRTQIHTDFHRSSSRVRIPMKSTTCSGHAVHLSERSDASEIIIHQVVGMGKGELILRRDSPLRTNR